VVQAAGQGAAHLLSRRLVQWYTDTPSKAFTISDTDGRGARFLHSRRTTSRIPFVGGLRCSKVDSDISVTLNKTITPFATAPGFSSSATAFAGHTSSIHLDRRRPNGPRFSPVAGTLWPPSRVASLCIDATIGATIYLRVFIHVTPNGSHSHPPLFDPRFTRSRRQTPQQLSKRHRPCSRLLPKRPLHCPVSPFIFASQTANAKPSPRRRKNLPGYPSPVPSR